MKKCHTCNKVIWPGQQSRISVTPLHLKCHQESLDKLCIDHPRVAEYMRDELLCLDMKGFDHGLIAPTRGDV